MATNGKDGMTPNVSFSGNDSSGQRGGGIFSYLQNRSTQTNFSREYYKEGSGYLDSALKDLKEMQKLYKQLEKSQSKMTTAQENQFKSQKRALELQIASLEDIKQAQEVSDRDAVRSIKDTNKIRQKMLLEYQKLLDGVAKRQEQLKSGDKELAKQLREDAEHVNEIYASVNKEVSQINLNIETTGAILKNTQTSFAKAMSNTLKDASDELSGLLNMFNLDKLANSGLNKFLTDKIAVQNDMMKQFGFETKNQYLDFKNGLDTTLESMGNLFSGTDLKQYMSNLSSMGITSTKMAQEQMRASIMGSKYLGVSAETQTEMFKWMKRTNDYDMLDEHNKIITGLLKSQLGLSKEQLDTMTQLLFSENDTMAAIGMSGDAIKAVNNAGLIGVATLSGNGIGISPEISAKVGQLYESLITTNPSDMGKWARLGIGDAFAIQNIGQNSTDLKTQYSNMQLMVREMMSSGILTSPDNSVRSELLSLFGKEYTEVFGALGSLNFSDWQRASSKAFENIDETLKSATSVMDSIKETTELTWLEKIYNRIDQWMTAWDAANLTSLANTVFVLWAGSKIFDAYAKISNLNLLSKIAGSSSATTSALSSGGTGILSSGGGVALGAASLAALSALIVKSTLNTASSKENLTEFANKNDSKTWLGKGLDLAKAGFSNSAGLVGQSLATSVRDSKVGRLLTATGLVSKDKLTDTALLAKATWLRVSSNFSSGLYGAEDANLYMLAALMAFDKSDWLKYINNKENHDSLVAWYNSLSDIEKRKVQKYASNDDDISLLAKDLDWSNYHKAGLSYVPRDNYKALLHKGEMVLNAEEARRYRGIGGAESVGPHATGTYGMNHKGIDVYFGQIGTPVGSAVPGIVVDSSDIPYNPNDGKKYHGADTNGNRYSSYGRVVKIKGDNDNLTYIYAHLNQRMVGVGQHVNAGDLIGYSGTTGNSSGPHLHFEIAGHGAGFNNHAPWFTSSVRNIGDTSGAVEQPITSSASNISSDGSTSSTIASSGIPVRTGRFSIFNNSGTKNTGTGGADKIVNSVNGGFGRLMNYLDNIRQEQDVQREMISAFSRTNTESTI